MCSFNCFHVQIAFTLALKAEMFKSTETILLYQDIGQDFQNTNSLYNLPLQMANFMFKIRIMFKILQKLYEVQRGYLLFAVFEGGPKKIGGLLERGA